MKTFAAGEKIALVYKKTGGATAVAVSDALKDDGDIASGAKSATFTFTLEDPDNTKNVSYVYPAAMAKADGSINYDALDAQDGTLASLASNLDLATYTAAWNGTALPNVTLDNQLAILALTLKDNATPTANDSTSTITGVTVSCGTNTYTVTRSAAAGPIYVAIQPTTSADIEVTATDGTKNYTKSLTGKTYEAGNGYSLSWRMGNTIDLSAVTVATTAQNGDVLTGTLGANVKISIADGATVTLNGATISGTNEDSYSWAGITCVGDANIILSGTNTVKGFYDEYPGIHVPSGSTLTIQGTGSLNASSNGKAAGIGGGINIACGNIEIQGGTINATGGFGAAGIGAGANSTCGSISITNGTVVAHAGNYAAGIGAAFANGNYSTCSGVSISGGSVTAYGGLGAAGIGSALSFTGIESYSQCGDISITGGTVVATGGNSTDIYHPAYQDNIHAYGGAGIGTGATAGDYSYQSNCGNITIGAGVTSVTATKGDEAQNSIGKNHSSTKGTCGTVSIEDGASVTQN